MSGSTTELGDCSVRVIDAERVRTVRAALPAEEEVTDLADMFGLLADPGRLRLMTSLLEAGELCVCDLSAATGMSESAVSHALRLLRAHRVVQTRRDGRMSFYRLADSHVRLLLDLGLQHIGHTTVMRVEGPQT